MTMHQDTSRKAYQAIKASLGEKQRQVYEVLKRIGPSTNRELAEELGWEINRVTPRVHELLVDDLVQLHSRRSCTITGFTAIAWELIK